MNVPAIAKKTYEQLKNQSEFISIVQALLESLKRISGPVARAQVVHDLVDEFNKEVFNHPLVKQMSPCKKGCSACCHTQVSVTDDEAEVLVLRIKEGLEVDLDRLRLQFAAKNDSDQYYRMKFQDRKCVFLDDQGSCRVYNDRPSVCRTNAVIGESSQCDTTVSIQETRLVRTPKSDMAVFASFLFARSSGTLPYMIGKRLDLELDEDH